MFYDVEIELMVIMDIESEIVYFVVDFVWFGFVGIVFGIIGDEFGDGVVF